MQTFLKINIAAFLLICLNFSNIYSQETEQPTIMVMPSDNWCIERGFYETYEDPQSGRERRTPDYRQAFQENTQLGLAVSKIGEIFSERGFPLRQMEETMRQVDQDAALDMADAATTTLKEEILKGAKADIVLYVNWSVEEGGPYKQVTFQIDAIDAYVVEQVGAASGTSPRTTGNFDELLQEAVVANITNLQAQMQDYFDDLRQNGRKIRMRVNVAENSPVNMNDYCSHQQDFQIREFFEGAVIDQSINNNYSIGTNSTNRLTFDIIRVPLIIERETPFGVEEVSLSARDFGEEIVRMIANGCNELERNQVSLTTIGLGEVAITLTN